MEKKNEGRLWSATSSLLRCDVVFVLEVICLMSHWKRKERGRIPTPLESNNWISFNHLHKSFHMSAGDSRSFIASQEGTRSVWRKTFNLKGISHWMLVLLFSVMFPCFHGLCLCPVISASVFKRTGVFGSQATLQIFASAVLFWFRVVDYFLNQDVLCNR